MLITALEANATVPTMDFVTEKLLHEERKKKEKEGTLDEKAMATLARKFNRKGLCYHCGKCGYFKRDCPDFSSEQNKAKKRSEKHTTH